ncbi:MAG: histidine phosphatase family protein, partial [Bacteroidales bacterium]|nr:histidine phosphatase family protein [Bacteroidales bacterium]
MKTAFVIRHSNRDSVTNPKNHAEVLLNAEGEKRAREFGKKLAQEFTKIRIYSSPIQRCIQTAKCIQEAFDDDSEVQLSTVLGEPGPYVFGDTAELFVTLGTVGVVEAIENGTPPPFNRKEEEGAKILLDFLRTETNKSDENTANVFITHDACIAPIIHCFTGEYFNKNHWIEFLGGLKIEFGEGLLN